MAKRFTATELWEEDWFLYMPSEYKLFWYYMLSKCNHAGIFKPNIKMFNFLSKNPVETEKALEYFNDGKDRIAITKKSNWWIIDFFVFQYGVTFNINNKLHLSIYNLYNQEGINMRSSRGLQVVKWFGWSGLIEDFDTLKEKVKDIPINSKEVNTEVKVDNKVIYMESNDTIVSVMVKEFIKKNPDYYSIQEIDAKALLKIANYIMDYKKWPLNEMGLHKKDIVSEWIKIIDFTKQNTLYSNFSIEDLQKKWTGVIQSMNNLIAVKTNNQNKSKIFL